MSGGTVSLKLKEVEICPQYEHWLGTLYVYEPYREQGIGSLLIQAAARVARRLGIHELFLYTRHQVSEALYARLGWEVLDRLAYRGRPAVIMKRSLDT
jgi:GNAT superfamily N-acetyltransferase